MSRRRATAGALAVFGCWFAATSATSAASPNRGPVRLAASFGPDARLGESTAMHAEFHVDTRRLSSPVTSVRVSYPRGIGLVTSGLGLASCVRSPAEFEKVLIERPVTADCSPNAVLAYGTA